MISNADAQDPPTTTTGDNNLNTGKYITNAEENKKKKNKNRNPTPKRYECFIYYQRLIQGVSSSFSTVL